MIYDVTLKTMGLATGALLVAAHIPALAAPAGTERFLRQFPRSEFWGGVLMALATVWAFLLVWHMDLGEFTRLRTLMLAGIAAGGVLAWIYVREFLAVRALGILALLAAEPLLGSAFLRPELSRLLLAVLAYAWILLGLFWVGMPYVLRDQIAWVTATRGRLRVAAIAGLVYGIALLVCAVFFFA